MSETDQRSVTDSFRAQPSFQGVTAVCPELLTTKQPALPVETQIATARSNLREFGIAAGMYLGAALLVASALLYQERARKHAQEMRKISEEDAIREAIVRHEVDLAERRGNFIAVSFRFSKPGSASPAEVIAKLSPQQRTIINTRHNHRPHIDIHQVGWITEREVSVFGMRHSGFCGVGSVWRLVKQNNQWLVV